MEAVGIQPDLNTLNALLNMYAEGMQPELAEEILGKLQACGMKARSPSTPPAVSAQPTLKLFAGPYMPFPLPASRQLT